MRIPSLHVAAVAAAGVVVVSSLMAPSRTARAQAAPAATPNADTIYVDAASPDRNEQHLCGKTVVVTFNGLRYSNAQLAVAHSYSLPTTISLFGNVAQAANIAPPATNASGGAKAPPPGTKGLLDANDPVRKAILDVNKAQKKVADFQKRVVKDAADVESLVLDADRDAVVREAAAGATTTGVIADAHALGQRLFTPAPPEWPTDDILDAAQSVLLAQATAVTQDQAKILTSLSTSVTAMQKAMSDPNDPTTLTVRSLMAWKRVLTDIAPRDFMLSTTVSCPHGAYADNAAVSFVAVDRTLASSNQAAANATPAGSGGRNASGGAGANRPELSGNGPTSNPGAQSGDQSTPSSQKQSTSISKAVAVVNAPSRLTATQGVGYSAIPNETSQVGTTLQNGANVSQVQSSRSDSGQAFLMTTLVHYRFNNPGPVGIHATVGLTTSKNQLVNGVAGASLSFNQAMYFTVGIFRADTTSVNGYTNGQIVPSGTTLSTKSQAVNHLGFAISIPVFPGESGKGTPPATPTPKPPGQ